MDGDDSPADGTGGLADAIDDRLDDYRDALFDLLAQPSVSATGEGIDDAAALTADVCERFGFAAELLETDGAPVVHAERGPGTDAGWSNDGAGGDGGNDGDGAGAERDDTDGPPTLVFYGHYDVQPPGDPDAWESPPFEPTVRDGSIYARGAGDNKGQFAAHAFAADALAAAGAAPDLRVRLLIDGGEETGSAGLRSYLAGGADRIADADLVYVADGPRHAVAGADGVRRGRPTLIYGNRGLLAFQLDRRTANTDLHSGNFGGPVPAATNRLVDALATLREGDEVLVDGFHEGIEVTDADRDLVEAIPDDGAAVAADLGLAADDLDGERYYERLLTEPTMTINGLSGGYAGEGMKTVLPATATAKVDCRLLPGQDPDAVLDRIREHLAAVDPAVEVTGLGSFPPMKTPVDTPAAPPIRRALAAVWETEPIELPVLGGSLPAAYFREAAPLSDVPVLVVPYANHDQGNHSPNEHLDLDCFENGIATSARAMVEVAAAL